jgi:hypothetical protein
MAQIFTALDGVKEKTIRLEDGLARIPRPVTWINGPGNILVSKSPWDSVKIQYDFVDKMEKLRPEVSGNGNLERFDYWLNQFKYLRSTGELACTLRLYRNAAQQMDKMDQLQKKDFAHEKLLQILKQEVSELYNVHRYLVSTISTWGEIGSITNWQQHVIPYHIQPQIKEIVKLTGDSSWVTDLFPKSLSGLKKLIIPSPQTTMQKGKDFTVKVLLFNIVNQKPVIHWRILGHKDFQQLDLTQTSRNYWLARIPAVQLTDDFEYYISVNDGIDFIFPASAPLINLAVVRY